MEQQVQQDNIAPEFAGDLALARQLARSAGPGGPPGTTRAWSVQINPTGTTLYAVACPAPAICYAAGEKGTIVATRNGGTTWRRLASRTSAALSGIACPALAICYAAGEKGTIVATRNGGATWRGQRTPLSGTGRELLGITCATVAICYAVGGIDLNDITNDHATILTTRDAGTRWQEQRPPLHDPTADILDGVACVGPSVCRVLAFDGSNNLLLSTTDGGRTWRSRVISRVASPTSPILNSLACPTPAICYAVGQKGAILATGDGGATWQGVDKADPFASTNTSFSAVACPTRTTCYAVGDAILATTGGGTGRAHGRATNGIRTSGRR